MLVVKECNRSDLKPWTSNFVILIHLPGIPNHVAMTIKKMGVASQFADDTGCYARGKEYGLSKSDSEIFFTPHTFMRYKEIPGVLLNGGL